MSSIAFTSSGEVFVQYDETNGFKIKTDLDNDGVFEHEVEKGDVNCDGLIDSVDAAAVLQTYADLSTQREIHPDTIYAGNELSDFNSDGFIDSVDASNILEKYAELSAKAKEANNKLNKNKEPLMNYIDKNKIDIRYEDIEKMADSGLGLDETIKNLGKDIKKYDKEIKQCDEQIRKYQIAKGNLGQEMTQENNELQELRQQQQPQQPQLQQGADKPKWYQFGKRIKNWIEQRKQAKLPEPSSAIPQNRPNTMRNALRYNILRDEFEKETGTRLKMAEKERKQEQQAREQQKPEGNER